MRNMKNQQTGIVKRHPDGFGFFVPDDPTHPDVYIPKHAMNGVMTNDKVTVRTQKESGENRYRGEVLKINERGTKTIVGKFTVHPSGKQLILDDGKGWGSDMLLTPSEEGNLKPQPGEWIAAEITTYPNEGKFTGKIVKIIGSLEDPMTDIERVAMTQHLPMRFSPQTEREARSIPEKVSEQDMRNRKNLRQLQFVTIDGATAKDFDDAIYVEQNDDGFKLFVAIADVSHYVRPGSAIDQDAYERGTSVYFPHFVIPMLPEVLSNGLCSLNPHVPRLALVAEMDIDFTGKLGKGVFYEATIESKARITYGEAQEIVEGNGPKKFGHVEAAVKRAGDLAKLLMANRFKEGSLDLDLPEVQIIVDEGGNPTDIVKSDRLFAHRMIEEMMLAANVAVARFLSDHEIPSLYRVHDQPKPEAIQMLEKYMRQFGSKLKLDGGLLQKKLTRALQEFQGKPEALVLNTLTLRSMAQAKYSNENVGHFGLGFSHYSHFTSPIRRYPDLIIHRLVKSQILRNSPYKAMDEDDLATAALMLSACEQRAVKAERQVQGIKKARFMQEHLGEEFDGVISSITRFGAFVTLRTLEVDGLVHIEALSRGPQDKLIFDEEKLRLVSKRSGFSYAIGDAIKIRVINVDIVTGQIDFGPAGKAAKKSVREEIVEADAGGKRRGKKTRGRAERGRARHEREREQQPQDEPPKAASHQRQGQRSGQRPPTGQRPPQRPTLPERKSPAPKQAPSRGRGAREVEEELDLDAMEVEEFDLRPNENSAGGKRAKLITNFEPPPQQSSFNPAAILERFFRRKGAPAASEDDRDERGHGRRETDRDPDAPPDRRQAMDSRSVRAHSPKSRGPKKSSRRPGQIQGRVSHKGGGSSGGGGKSGGGRKGGGRGGGGRQGGR